MGSDREQEHAFLDQMLIPYFRANAEMRLKSGLTEVDCGQAIALATLVAFEEGLGTCGIGTGELEFLQKALDLTPAFFTPSQPAEPDSADDDDTKSAKR